MTGEPQNASEPMTSVPLRENVVQRPVACWIQRATPDARLPLNAISHRILFDRDARKQLDAVTPRMNDAEFPRELDTFVSERKQLS